MISRRCAGIGGWRRAQASDLPDLAGFLEDGEERKVGFSGRLLKDEASGPVLRLPAPLRGSVWILGGEPSGAEPKAPGPGGGIVGALLCHPSRLAFPIFPEGREEDSGLALLASSFSPASALGMASDVERYESLVGAAPKASVSYKLMAIPAAAAAAAPERPAPYPDLVVRRAVAADLDSLLGLQEAYEREEVLTPIHCFDGKACRASLARALARQLIFAAWEDGIAVAKAGTNARGFGVDQVGGVYTLPERRGRGLGAALMALVLRAIREEGKRPTLFVKPHNAPARALYRGLGFEELGDYRADYFGP